MKQSLNRQSYEYFKLWYNDVQACARFMSAYKTLACAHGLRNPSKPETYCWILQIMVMESL